MTLTLNPQTEAKLSTIAARRGLTLGETVDQAMDALLAEETQSEAAGSTEAGKTADQAARHAVLADILLKAQAMEPEPPDSPARKVYQEDAAGQVVVEKYRRQGFNM